MRSQSAFGALLRRYRLRAGLTQEALAERAQLSVRGVIYLERGTRQPQPDTLARLAAALALTSAQQEALAEALLAPEPTTLESAPVVPAVAPTPLARASAAPLVGREQELAVLRHAVATTFAGRGGLVLLSGEAGVGKSTLAEALCREAREQGALVLVGRCYDLSETPPYGPWIEAQAQFPPASGLPSLPSALHTAARSPGQFFAQMHDFFAAATARQPIVLLLDDVHWADPASLDLLRYLARSLGTLRLLILVTYRPGEIDRHHPLHQILPLLVREADATRVAIAPLTSAALQALVQTRYAIAPADEARLVAYLARRSEGNALFATELLHTLAEVGALTPGSTTVGDLEAVGVPLLLRQVIEGRVVRLGSDAEELLGIAAVIGQEVELDVWAHVAAVDEWTLDAVVDRAVAAGLLGAARGGEHVTFAHALIREALYEGVPALRRRRLHRATAEALAAVQHVAPDIVAYHFQHAGDARATTWLMHAGWLAYRSFAYTTARARLSEALPGTEGSERARVLLTLATLDRYRAPGIRYAAEAMAAAQGAGDMVLAASAQFRLGVNLNYHGRVREALAATAAAPRILDTVPDDALPEFHGLYGLGFPRSLRGEYRASVLAYSGRWQGALSMLGGTQATMAASLDQLQAMGLLATAYADAMRGRVADARRNAAALRAMYEARGDVLAMLAAHMIDGCLLLLPFLLDDQDARRRYDEELSRITRRIEEDLGTVPHHLNHCPLLIVRGQWAEAWVLWGQRDSALAVDLAGILPHLGATARAQGAHDDAWTLVHAGLPDGAATEPGTAHFTALDLHGIAVRLCLDVGDHEGAQQWLEAHERWVEWVGAEVCWGRADGQLAWAEYHHASGDSETATAYAERALMYATAPRQPLALLAAHRLLGKFATDGDRHDVATAHLDAALQLANACASPYERALTLLAMAELRQVNGDRLAARDFLDTVRALCTPLGALPALARADALAADRPDNVRSTPVGSGG